MPKLDLNYGNTTLPFEYDESRFDVLAGAHNGVALTDAEIGLRLDTPTGSRPLEEIISPGETVLIVVPDGTRQIGCGQVVNLLVRRLIANGTAAFDIRIIFATGIHRRVSDEEKAEILTPFIAQRIKTLDHAPRDLMQIVRLGKTSGGIPVELNRALVEHDHVILVGGVSFHYFAGFTGGRKLICPGLASTRTIAATHKLAFDCDTMDRRHGVGTGILDGNAVHQAFVDVVQMAAPAFAITTVVNEAGEITDLFCGDWQSSHRVACEEYSRKHTIKLAERREMVVVSCGGWPHDINMIQAHKALDAASKVCASGGKIVFLAECRYGLGRNDFLDWFSAGNSRELASRLCDKYQVNGQTAFSLLQKTERFDVRIVTSLGDDAIHAMRFWRAVAADLEIGKAARDTSGYIILQGAKLNFQITGR